MSTMLLSIKPKYAKVILEGNKLYEFRKSRPKTGVDRIIFYASAPQKEVVGEATIDEILEGTPKEVWEIAKSAAGITSSAISKLSKPTTSPSLVNSPKVTAIVVAFIF